LFQTTKHTYTITDQLYSKLPQPDFADQYPYFVTHYDHNGDNAVYAFDDQCDWVPKEYADVMGFARVEDLGMYQFKYLHMAIGLIN
jgi:hypothetical protein